VRPSVLAAMYMKEAAEVVMRPQTWNRHSCITCTMHIHPVIHEMDSASERHGLAGCVTEGPLTFAGWPDWRRSAAAA